MTGGRVFIDTNILLRAMFPDLAQHQAANALIEQLWVSDAELWISRQVIREYLVQATHPRTFVTPAPIQQIASQIEIIQSLFHIADDTAEVTTQLLALLQEFPTSGKQIHDANIVASMLVYGVDTLATLNIEDMKRFKPRIALLSVSEASA